MTTSSPAYRAIAATSWLKDHNTELTELRHQLQTHNYEVISTVSDLCRHLLKIKPDFDADVDVETILNDVIQRLCLGENAQFQGVVILFDELYNYLRTWSADPVNAGGMTLQNITNVCEQHKGKITLLCLTQKSLNSYTPRQEIDSYKRLATRLELKNSTYEPIASLELVIKGLFNQRQQTAAWADFAKTHTNTLMALNVTVYRDRTGHYYQSRNWQPQDLYKHITLGCFPLHPLTTYLLCNLDFAQGRTAIQFAQSEAKHFIDHQPLLKNGRLNLINPVTLIDAFAENFKAVHSRQYSDYEHTCNKISASATPEEMTVLKGILLYNIASSFTSSTRRLLKKSETEKHEMLLETLTGFSSSRLKEVLHQLVHDRRIIFHAESDHTYRFYEGGVGVDEFFERIYEKIGNRKAGIDRVQDYLMTAEGAKYLGGETASPHQFIQDHKLAANDWQVPQWVRSDRLFRQFLTNSNALGDEMTAVLYVIADSPETLTHLNTELDQLLTPKGADLNGVQRRIVVCVSQEPASELAQMLYQLEFARKEKVQEWGAVKQQGIVIWEQTRDRLLKSLFQNSTYHCHLNHKIPAGDRKNLNLVLSALFQDLYPFVPSVANVDKMAENNTRSGKILGYICKQLLQDTLQPQSLPGAEYRNVIDPVLVTTWGMLQKASDRYILQEPTNRNLKAAWDQLSELTAVKSKDSKEVEIDKIWELFRQPPYGYNKNTFALLFTSWIAFHRSEVVLRGSFGIPKANQSIYIQTEPIKAWVNTPVFDKPKDFIDKWVSVQGKKAKSRPILVRRKVQPMPQLPASVTYGEARDRWLPDLETYLQNPDETAPIEDLKAQCADLKTAIQGINAILAVIQKTELLPSEPELTPLIDLSRGLEAPFKPMELPMVTVCPDEADVERYHKARQGLRHHLSAFVDDQGAQVATLVTIEDCHAQLNDVELYQRQVAELPGNLWRDRFTQIQQDIKHRINEITEGDQLQRAVERVERLYDSLSENATQADYDERLGEIEQQAAMIPALKIETGYQKAIAAIQGHQTDLQTQLTTWEQDYRDDLSAADAFRLNQALSNQTKRYTDPNSQARLSRLHQQLEVIILNGTLAAPPLPDPEEAAIATWRDRLTTLTAQVNASQTLSQWETCLATLHQHRQDPGADHCVAELERLEQTLRDRITQAHQDLDRYNDRLQHLTTTADLLPLRTTLLKTASTYQQSSLADRYHRLNQETDDLIQLLQLYEQTHKRTPQDCDDLRQRLDGWLNQVQLSDTLNGHFNRLSQGLAETRDRLRHHQETQAQHWLKTLGDQVTTLMEDTNPQHRSHQAQVLLSQITQNRAKHSSYLTHQLRESLDHITHHCQSLINLNTSHEIERLFQTLAPPERQTLYQRLQTYL
ncbi:hypothetical protein PN441_19530 [Spirulina major CS-329]|uniref:hypothetical protein n=1 Tax=Spirulina TaxID=1154 RepID=UPI00232C6EAF|nr:MULTISPECIES: hypothetical protein [Spirulina]MDB9494647.1 hypothetical protein [Spirulina subsalsa CS-330]MDB9505276.1 hypothetical protein [Spirulina major CS-329]